ncbi:MAG: type II secretion system GspH family protein [Acidobacteriota bacterium]|nr:type II secretion system GspH family protein [Acidobacteriota bacterium]
MKHINKYHQRGFSLLELMIAMTIILVMLGAASTLLFNAFGTRTRESQKTDALISAQAALDSMSREIANSGYGLSTNGIVTADSHAQRLRFRANVVNDEPIQPVVTTSQLKTDDPNEDVTYYFDSSTQSILRYDRFANPTTTIIVNQISDVKFEYFDYSGSSSAATQKTVPTKDTGRIKITVLVRLDPIAGQPNQTEYRRVTLTSDVTLRNSEYMRYQY